MSETKVINAPMPGVFYRRPSPEEALFVNEGDEVKNGDVIGLIEVMKNFFELKADADGIVESFKAENEDIVSAGQEIAVIRVKS